MRILPLCLRLRLRTFSVNNQFSEAAWFSRTSPTLARHVRPPTIEAAVSSAASLAVVRNPG